MSKLFKKRVLEKINILKQEKYSIDDPQRIPIYDDKGLIVGYLRPISKSTFDNDKEIKLLARWRKENIFAYLSQGKITFEGTKTWVKKGIIYNPTRILFFIELIDKTKPVGHIGLASFNFRDNSCEIDNVVRGDKKAKKGIMTFSLFALLRWAKCTLSPSHIYLRVLSDNTHALDFYKRNKFKQVGKIPLEEIKKGQWVENPKLKNAKRYFVKMKLS